MRSVLPCPFRPPLSVPSSSAVILQSHRHAFTAPSVPLSFCLSASPSLRPSVPHSPRGQPSPAPWCLSCYVPFCGRRPSASLPIYPSTRLYLRPSAPPSRILPAASHLLSRGVSPVLSRSADSVLLPLYPAFRGLPRGRGCWCRFGTSRFSGGRCWGGFGASRFSGERCRVGFGTSRFSGGRCWCGFGASRFSGRTRLLRRLRRRKMSPELSRDRNFV